MLAGSGEAVLHERDVIMGRGDAAHGVEDQHVVEAWRQLSAHLSLASALATAAYSTQPMHTLDAAKQHLLGHHNMTIGSCTHPTALKMGFKLTLPRQPPHMTAAGEPLHAPELDTAAAELHVTLAIRGSTPPYMVWRPLCVWCDWVAADAHMWLGDAHLGLPYRLFSGFAVRHARYWHVIQQHIETALAYATQQHPNVKVRFAITGHSQGGGLATLAALHCFNTYRTRISGIALYTFESPALFAAGTADALEDTCIRHFRFACDHDAVTLTRLGASRRKHVGSTHLLVSAAHLHEGLLRSHTGYAHAVQRLIGTGRPDLDVLVSEAADGPH